MSELNQPVENSDLPRFESMSFGMILDRAINLYVKNFVLLAGIMIIPQTLNYLNGLLFGKSATLLSGAGYLLYLPVFLLLYLLIFGISSGAITVAVSSRYLGKEITIVRAYKASFRRLGTLLGAWIVAYILIILGSLLIIPGIILMVLYSLITPVVMLENLSASESRKRSRELIKGYGWQTLGLFLIYFILHSALYYGLIFLTGLLSSAVENIFTSTYISMYMPHLISAALQIVSAPFPAIIIILVYYNQRIRKESFDLVMLAEALAEE